MPEAPPAVRRQHILTWLQAEGSISISQLAERLDVSIMTVHRDLNVLAEEGGVRKLHGAVILDSELRTQDTCEMCGMINDGRTSCRLHMEDGSQIEACCPHCGLMLIHRKRGVESAFIRDYLYGYMVNANSALYVMNSGITLCCRPSLLAFATVEDAERFVTGFGGTVLTYAEAMTHIQDAHSI